MSSAVSISSGFVSDEISRLTRHFSYTDTSLRLNFFSSMVSNSRVNRECCSSLVILNLASNYTKAFDALMNILRGVMHDYLTKFCTKPQKE